MLLNALAPKLDLAVPPAISSDVLCFRLFFFIDSLTNCEEVGDPLSFESQIRSSRASYPTCTSTPPVFLMCSSFFVDFFISAGREDGSPCGGLRAFVWEVQIQAMVSHLSTHPSLLVLQGIPFSVCSNLGIRFWGVFQVAFDFGDGCGVGFFLHAHHRFHVLFMFRSVQNCMPLGILGNARVLGNCR